MAMFPQGIKVAGQRYHSHASLRVEVVSGSGGTPPPNLPQHVDEINYSQAVSPVIQHGVHSVPLPRGDGGTYQANASMTVTLESWRTWLENFPAASTGGAGITDHDFDISFHYLPPKGDKFTVLLKEASILSVSGGSSNSRVPMVQLNLHVRWIEENGRCLVALDQDRGQ